MSSITYTADAPFSFCIYWLLYSVSFDSRAGCSPPSPSCSCMYCNGSSLSPKLSADSPFDICVSYTLFSVTAMAPGALFNLNAGDLCPRVSNDMPGSCALRNGSLLLNTFTSWIMPASNRFFSFSVKLFFCGNRVRLGASLPLPLWLLPCFYKYAGRNGLTSAGLPCATDALTVSASLPMVFVFVDTALLIVSCLVTWSWNIC